MSGLHPLVERVLEKRGIADADAFLNPLYDARHDPFSLLGMQEAVARIFSAMEREEKICIWHDYDCDGIPGGALLFDFFRRIDYPVETYVPERSEGYGLNEAGVRALAASGVKLIVTVDCGITDVAETALANSLGIDVIITDHHLPQKELPPALAVVDAHQASDTYPFKELCGTGVAFKLVEALVAENRQFHIWNWPEGQEKWLLDLVALATVADMVPLQDENRTLVRFGLTVIAKGRRPGLRALLALERVPLEYVTEDDLAFSVAPKINAASRMASPKLAFELLTTESVSRAEALAKELVKLNQARKLEGMRVSKEVKRKLDALPTLGDVIVMGATTWRPSLLGIAATSVVETYGKTVCLWGMDGELIKGSCRSDGSVNIVELMSEARDAFLDFGGHELSGGFSVSPEKIHELPEALARAYARASGSADGLLTKTNAEPDDAVTLAEVTDSAFDALRDLAPFGMENPKPVFRFSGVSVASLSRFGKAEEHLRAVLQDDAGASAEAIAFFVARTSFKHEVELLSPGDRVTLDASIERSHFRGKKELRLRIERLTLE
ncbi:MAG: single-stranded-DNA-specific exonuclease RecJ [Patescibacteria group bacterium]|nr:single-stranded-DNA-specific exonuclease RecJ [Patescibacteria group bacterium]